MAALAAVPHAARADTLELHNGDLGVALRVDSSSSVHGDAEVRSAIAGLDVGLRAGLQAGAGGAGEITALAPAPLAPVPVNAWDGLHLDADLAWRADGLSLALRARSQARRAFYEVAPAGWGSADRAVAARQEAVGAAASLDLARPLRLQLDAEVAGAVVDTLQPGREGGDPASLSVYTARRKSSARLHWTLSPVLEVQGGGEVQAVGANWAGRPGAAVAFADLDPSLSATVKPWAGGDWSVGVERVAAAFDARRFVQVADARSRFEGFSYEPDRELRYHAGFRQTLGEGATVSAGFTAARLRNVTEFGAFGAAEAPVSLGAGSRRRVDLSVTSPWRAPGLGGTVLGAEASLDASRVLDPTTGATRPISGDERYRAALRLTRATKGDPWSWGVKAEFVGEQPNYEPLQSTVLSPTAGVGGFIAFSPGPFAVKLEARNLIGGERTATTAYMDSARPALDRVVQTELRDRAVSLSLAKSF